MEALPIFPESRRMSSDCAGGDPAGEVAALRKLF